jgi:hypothetical protein
LADRGADRAPGDAELVGDGGLDQARSGRQLATDDAPPQLVSNHHIERLVEHADRAFGVDLQGHGGHPSVYRHSAGPLIARWSGVSVRLITNFECLL